MPRGRKKTHKGGHRHFSNAEELKVEAEKAEKQKAWREKMGIPSDEDEEEEAPKAAAAAAAAKGQPGELPPSSDEEESSEEEEEQKAKGVQHLIDVENPNRVVRQTKKVTELGEGAKPQLSRREREELEKQQAKANYQKLHLAGKTDEARADLARLALIRKQREDAARKREAEKKEQDDARIAAEKKLLEKKSKAAGK